MAVKKSGLGKGLDALFADAAVSTGGSQGAEQNLKNINAHGETAEDAVRYIDINDIAPNEDQPRKVFDEEKLLELADSIKKHGIIQPLVLRKTKTGYSLVAGERRWRAARLADLKEVPCIIKKLTDEENMLLAIIENMQREDLDPIEEAEGLDKMAHTYGLTQEQIAKSISKSRPYVTNSLRLLKLSEEVQRMVSAGNFQGVFHPEGNVLRRVEEKKHPCSRRQPGPVHQAAHAAGVIGGNFGTDDGFAIVQPDVVGMGGKTEREGGEGERFHKRLG